MADIIDFQTKKVEREIAEANTYASKSFLFAKAESCYSSQPPSRIEYSLTPEPIEPQIVIQVVEPPKNTFWRNLFVWFGLIILLAMFGG